MEKLYSEICKTNTDDEIRAGYASWDKGKHSNYSVKYTWRDKRGYACRGGEVPAEALPQMVDVALKQGYLTKSDFKGIV